MMWKIKEMKKQVKNDALVRGSFVLLIMIGLFNLLNYIFQISMAIMLGPADYSVLAVLMSLIYIMIIPSESIQTVITRYTSKYEIKKELGKIKDLFYRSIRKGLLFSVVFFVFFLIFGIFFSKLLKIEFFLIAITGLFIFYVFSVPIVRGILQGKKKFLNLGMNMIIESGIKVIFSIILVFLGWKVYGAIGSLIFGGLIAFLFAFISIKDVFSSKRKRGNFKNVYRYNLPILIGVTSIVLIYSIDVIFARLFFSPELAGKYSFVSLIGKVVVFSSFAITKALFPLSSEQFEKGNKTISLLKKAILLISIISIIFLLFSFLIPREMIYLISLGSSQYLDASNILFILSLAFSLAAFTNIIVMYSLSVNKIRKSSLFLLVFVLIEVLLFYMFHSNLFQFSISLLFVNIIMFLCSIILIRR